MFDFAWSELALIGVVALVLIGPKDLPVAIKAVTNVIKKARRMAGEFQTHVDEMVRDANLQDAKSTFDDLRRLDIKSTILNAVDGDSTIRKALNENPLDIHPAPPPVPVADHAAPAALPEVAVGEAGAHAILAPNGAAADGARDDGPPSFVPPQVAAAGHPERRPAPPPFVPPAAAAAAARRTWGGWAA